ncbi:MAG TPA: glycine oxidase ThiO [Polyangiaceae bacterium]|jgi:glycine oxidase|nr:glycine oxidase ThiO [Polyangiaceae bacterium]
MPRTTTKVPDVLIIGGGIMGTSAAWELAAHGTKVVVLERSVPGAEASSAAAGILGAQAEAHAPGAMAELCLASRARYGAFATTLSKETQIDVGYRECGVLQVAFARAAAAKLAAAAAWQKRRRLAVEPLSAARLAKHEPQLSSKLAGGVRFAADSRIEPKALLRALHIAALGRGVRFQSGAFVRRVVVTDNRAVGVALDDGSVLHAHNVVVAAGSWTSLIDGLGLPAGQVIPARGQIVELELPAPALSHVVFGPGAYLVPRDDGRVLVGSTVEFVGYEREVTAGAVRDLLTHATAILPALERAGLRATWSSFRPYTKDELPLLGRTKIERLFLSTGHYRNGILLAPISAEIVRAAVLGQRAPVAAAALRAFSPERGR